MTKILRFAEVRQRTGLSRSTVYRRIRIGAFPIPVDLGNGRLGWFEKEIETWILQRLRHIPKGHGRAKPKIEEGQL